MDKVIIKDLEVFFYVGVPPEERAHPQRLLITLELTLDVHTAAARDDLSETVDYATLTEEILKLGKGRSWKLIETAATQIADLALQREPVMAVTVEVKKFIIPQSQYVSIILERKKT
jgi:7,8-dihydroneopterin aldolase/epimerase/oxygenase